MTVKAKPYSEVAIGLAFAAGGVGICLHAAGLRSMPGMVVGSGLFPTITGACMILFGLVLAAGALLAGRVPAPATSAAPGRSGFFSLYSLAVLALLIALTTAMPPVGFILSGMVFTAAVTRLGGAGWIGSLVFAAAITLALYYVFVFGLRVQLPRGLWGF